ncbi:hypothetical protein Nepgr_006833 [Nepenthes gracilis]|uniref:Uncharacterized protein n=1 Tax=Nepenthes gracilis TaxID=150966 RepID=A0AAD3XHQ9_NEPGR|nr:hypothetical protein Nepgr_006833 [Nepenthes gracilis]
MPALVDERLGGQIVCGEAHVSSPIPIEGVMDVASGTMFGAGCPGGPPNVRRFSMAGESVGVVSSSVRAVATDDSGSLPKGPS